jgi:hypothetical protein
MEGDILKAKMTVKWFKFIFIKNSVPPTKKKKKKKKIEIK